MCKKNKVINYDKEHYKRKCRAVEEVLEEMGIQHRTYHYKEQGIRYPVRMTACVGKLPSGECVRGLAICSSEDNFCRPVGRYYSLVRVLKAAIHGRNCEAVNRDEVFGRLAAIPKHKAHWNIPLTEWEQSLFGEVA